MNPRRPGRAIPRVRSQHQGNFRRLDARPSRGHLGCPHDGARSVRQRRTRRCRVRCLAVVTPRSVLDPREGRPRGAEGSYVSMPDDYLPGRSTPALIALHGCCQMDEPDVSVLTREPVPNAAQTGIEGLDEMAIFAPQHVTVADPESWNKWCPDARRLQLRLPVAARPWGRPEGSTVHDTQRGARLHDRLRRARVSGRSESGLPDGAELWRLGDLRVPRKVWRRADRGRSSDLGRWAACACRRRPVASRRCRSGPSTGRWTTSFRSPAAGYRSSSSEGARTIQSLSSLSIRRLSTMPGFKAYRDPALWHWLLQQQRSAG